MIKWRHLLIPILILIPIYALSCRNSGAGYYRWRVKVAELWSESATFDIVSASVFKDSKWIGGGSEVMQTIQLSTAQVTHARAYCAGLGSYKLFINGLPVDNHIMDAGEAGKGINCAQNSDSFWLPLVDCAIYCLPVIQSTIKRCCSWATTLLSFWNRGQIL